MMWHAILESARKFRQISLDYFDYKIRACHTASVVIHAHLTRPNVNNPYKLLHSWTSSIIKCSSHRPSLSIFLCSPLLNLINFARIFRWYIHILHLWINFSAFRARKRKMITGISNVLVLSLAFSWCNAGGERRNIASGCAMCTAESVSPLSW